MTFLSEGSETMAGVQELVQIHICMGMKAASTAYRDLLVHQKLSADCK